MDYRKLLLKYVKHVIECEGFDFTGSLNAHPEVQFEEDEEQELLRIVKEADELEFI